MMKQTVTRLLPRLFMALLALLLPGSPAVAQETGGTWYTRATDKIKTPDWYDSKARPLIKKAVAKDNEYRETHHNQQRPLSRDDEWYQAKPLIDEGLKKYPDVSPLNELAGHYNLRMGDYDAARFYLYKAIDANNGNVQAKQLMVDVEDSTRNYSSAICYVNELLEVNPYWRGQWLRKIELFTKQGNYEEADRLTHRLLKIYPSDTIVTSRFRNRAAQKYKEARSDEDHNAMLTAMQELISNNLALPEHYLQAANLHLQVGNSQAAIDILGKGLMRFPDNETLIRKKVGVLTGAGRHSEAMGFIDGLLASNPKEFAYLRQLRQNLTQERAEQTSNLDPYTLYGKVWEQRHSKEALDYLLRISFGRGYDADALYYLHEARRVRGDQPELLYREYLVNKRMGNDAPALALLEQLYRTDSTNLDVAEELARVKMRQAVTSMQTGEYEDAIEALRHVSPRDVTPETADALFNRLFACYDRLGQWQAALDMADTLRIRVPESNYVARRASILSKAGRTEEALDFVADTLAHLSPDSAAYQALASTYEELAIPHIKTLIESGNAEAAYRQTQRLLGFVPDSPDALRLGLSTAALTRRNSEQQQLLAEARRRYPGEMDFVVKQAAFYDERGEHETALQLVRHHLDSLPANTALIAAHSATAEQLALARIRQRQPDAALAVVDTALLFDPSCRPLLYTKGLAYEALHRYDSAHHYQRLYQPASAAEERNHRQHLKGLLSRNARNNVGFEYWRGRYGHNNALTAVATGWYSHHKGRNTWTATANYAGRDADPEAGYSGGIGVQGIVGYERQCRKQWTANAALGAATRHFPTLYASVGAERELPRDWSVRAALTYRRPEHRNLGQLRLCATKTIDRFALDPAADLFLFKGQLYYSTQLRFRYMPLDDQRTAVFALAAAGTAPEATLIDAAMPSSFSRLNGTVAMGGTYLLLPTLIVGVTGSWNTFYLQTGSDSHVYRNLYNISVQMTISF